MSFLSIIINRIKKYNKLRTMNIAWRNHNRHNFTTISKDCLRYNIDINTIVSVGKGSYGEINIKYFYNKNEHLKIGNYCSVAEGVVFLLGGEHSYRKLSTYPFGFYYNIEDNFITPSKGPIVINDDVWIGQNSLILSGVTVGQGAIIGAGSVVTKDIPPYAIFAGGKVIKFRFDQSIIEKLCKFDFSRLTEEELRLHPEYFTSDLILDFFETEFYKTHLS